MSIVTRVVAALEAIAGDIKQRPPTYSSRPEAEASTPPTAQTTIHVNQNGLVLGFVRDPGGDAITTADGSKWSPTGDVYPDHWQFNATPGTTDMGQSILKALWFSPEVNLDGVDYATSVEIKWNNRSLRGKHEAVSRIIGLSGSMAASTPILTPGRSANVTQLQVRYDALSGAEARDERVGINLGGDNGSIYVTQRAGKIDRVFINECGTAMSDYGRGVFSSTICAVDVGSHSFMAIDIRGQHRTGNLFENIYINGGDNYTPKRGFNLEGQVSGGNAGQLNVEHTTYSEAVISVTGGYAFHFTTCHLEGVALSTQWRGFVETDKALVSFGSFHALNMRMPVDNVSLFRMYRGGYVDTGNYAFKSVRSGVRIGTLHVRGLADPNVSIHSSYPAGRRGIEKIGGFKFFSRAAEYTDKDVSISVEDYLYAAYVGRTAEAEVIYAYPDTRGISEFDNIEVHQFEHRGTRVVPRENIARNGDFKEWVNVSASATDATAESARMWTISSGPGGTVTATAMESIIGNGYDYIRVSNKTTAAAYQHIHLDVPFDRSYAGKQHTLSFDMRGETAGKVLHQLTASLYTDGGSPVNVFTQIEAGTSARLDADTDWQRYHFTFEVADEAGVSVWGDNPYLRIRFQMNDSTADQDTYFDLRRVKLEVGSGASDFSVNRADLEREEFFSAYLDTTAVNMTGDGAYPVIPFDTVSQNIGGGFNAATGQFIVPRDGIYEFSSAIRVVNTTGATIGKIRIGVHGSQVLNRDAVLAETGLGDLRGIITASYRLKAGDIVSVRVFVNGIGSAVCDVVGSEPDNTWFSGYRVAS